MSEVFLISGEVLCSLQTTSSHGCRLHAVRLPRGMFRLINGCSTHLVNSFQQAVRPKFAMAKDLEEAAIAVDEMYNLAYQVAG